MAEQKTMPCPRAAREVFPAAEKSRKTVRCHRVVPVTEILLKRNSREVRRSHEIKETTF